MIARSGLEAKDIAPFLAALLSIPFEGRYPALEMAPSEQKERTIAALIDAVRRADAETPRCWRCWRTRIGSTRLRSTCSAGSSIGCRDLRALLVITFRPEFAAPWVGRAHVASLSLNRFGRRQALAMVERRRGRQGAAGGSAGADRRQDRRRAAVRGGTDQDGAGVRPAARGGRRLCSRPRR